MCIVDIVVAVIGIGLSGWNVLGFADTMDQSVPAVAHDGTHAEEEHAGAGALGKVAL